MDHHTFLEEIRKKSDRNPGSFINSPERYESCIGAACFVKMHLKEAGR